MEQTHLQPLYRPAPLGCGWAADGVLVAEQTDLFDGLFKRHGLQPFHGHEVLAQRWIIAVFGVVGAACCGMHYRRIEAVVGHGEVCHRCGPPGYAADADVALLRNVDPHPVAGGEHLQAVAVPSAATATDKTIGLRIQPGTCGTVAKRAIELTIPRLAQAIAAGVAGIGLGFHRVEQPGAADQLLRALLEHL